MEKNIKGLQFANTIISQDNRMPPHSSMSVCERFGMTFGCRVHCPALVDGDCQNIGELVDIIKQEADEDEIEHLKLKYEELDELIK